MSPMLKERRSSVGPRPLCWDLAFPPASDDAAADLGFCVCHVKLARDPAGVGKRDPDGGSFAIGNFLS